MKNHLLAAALVIIAAVTAGCGGSGSMMTTPSGSTAKTVSGTVADGYLVGAQVFLDRNLNYILDSGEPSATTGTDGSFSLTLESTDYDANGYIKYPLVAIAIAGTTYDLDTPTTPVSSTYVLSMHGLSISPVSGGVVGSASNVVSPFSTQIREMMETGTYSTVADAAAALRTQLGLPTGTDMMKDYIRGGDSTMHTAARNMVKMMQGQAAQVMTGTRPDVTSYQGMMGSIFSHMSTVRPHPIPDGTIAANVPPKGRSFMNFSTMFRGRMRGGMMR